MDHVIKEGNRLFAGTPFADCWLIYHDALSSWWSKGAQAHMRSKGFEDRQIRGLGHTNEGTSYEGVEYGGKQFDTSIQTSGKGNKKTKTQVPLPFKLGEGKAIRGWEECVKTMTLGEKLTVTIGPKWAYRKGGLQDDNGKYLVPPNATLVFEMRLVQVRDQIIDPNS